MQTRPVLATNIRKPLGARGMSLETLAEHARLDRIYTSLLKREKHAENIDAIDRTAQALRTTTRLNHAAASE